MSSLWGPSKERTKLLRASPTLRNDVRRETDRDLCTVDRPGAARAPLSVRRWNQVRAANRGDDEADARAAAGPVPPVHRRDGSARRARADPAWASPYPARADAPGRRGPRDHHDRCDSDHADWR